MHLTSRIFATALAIALLGAQSVPCGIAQADALRSSKSASAQTLFKARGHLGHAHGAMAHTNSEDLEDSKSEHATQDEHPSLRAYCACGCSGAAKSNIPAYRLGFSLLSSVPQVRIVPDTATQAWLILIELPIAPTFALEHVPLAA